MVKRKTSTSSDAKTVKKAKNPGVDTGKLDCSTPEKALSSLIVPNKLKDFFNSYWEKKPLHIKRKDADFYGSLFSLENLKEIMEEHQLEFESDVNVCRYVEGEKELLNEEGQITIKQFEGLMKEQKATFQVHQPQRFNKNLWQLMERMETYFGALVGSNVYITPADAQGLAPHCDDVEIFVLQLEGKKTWKLYTPMVELSKDYTQDLLQESIGDPFFEETLEPGDLLYFPRGTIHQAKTGSEGHSTHISISTYQQNTLGDFMQHAISQAIENAMEDDVTFRAGLPINYLKFLGTGKNMSKYVEDDGDKEKVMNEDQKEVKNFRELIKKLLPKLVDHIDVNTAADSMCADFMSSRLPPYGYEIKEDDEEDRKPPTLEDRIKLRFPEHVRIEYVDDDEEDENADMSQIESDDSDMEDVTEEEKPAKNGKAKDSSAKKADSKRKPKSGKSDTEDDEDDEDANPPEEGPCIKIIHSLNNDRESHMVGMDMSGLAGALKLPLHFAKAAIKLMNRNDFVAVKDLDLEEEEDKIIFATTLFADDLIEIQS